jgi:ubiquinone/menaquinone biosynthesis C-methylase UbiE
MSTTEIDALKSVHRATWASGDYAAVAELIDEVPPRHLLAAVGVSPNHDVLDVATGTGNVALRAAAAGARVVGLDLTPDLFECARRRAETLDVAVDWIEGDAEELPFENASFDRVLSVFGVQFAPRHSVVAAELVRVCRPGGAIGLVNWTPAGKVGELFRILAQYLPKPPAFASPPPLWGDKQHVRALFAGADVSVRFEYATTPWSFASADEYASFMEANYGPLVKARERLSAEGSWEPCRTEIVAMMNRRNEAPDGRLLVPAQYLVTIIDRRS